MILTPYPYHPTTRTTTTSKLAARTPTRTATATLAPHGRTGGIHQLVEDGVAGLHRQLRSNRLVHKAALLRYRMNY